MVPNLSLAVRTVVTCGCRPWSPSCAAPAQRPELAIHKSHLNSRREPGRSSEVLILHHFLIGS
jgi:hypothetical protein